MAHVAIKFEITDHLRFVAAYRKALKSSGLDAAECRKLVANLDYTAALAEIMADAGFDWERFGLGY